MKSMKRLLSLLFAVVLIAASIPFTAAPASAATTKIYGIDVSKWQGTAVDWNKVKAAGYQFVILRVGYSTTKDPTFEINYAGAKAAGLSVGVYYYSYATSVATSKSNANLVLTWLQGKQFEYPIYIDMEDSCMLATGITNATRTAIADEFLQILQSNGYFVGVYSGRYWYNTYLDKAALAAKYTIWQAQYLNSGTDSSDKSGECDMWQYSSSGDGSAINAATTGLDLNVSYVDFKSIIVNGGFNGFSSGTTTTPDTPATTTKTVGVYTTTASSLNMREGVGTSYNVITTLPQGTEVSVIGFNDAQSWAMVNYNGTIGWISLTYATYTRPFSYTCGVYRNDGTQDHTVSVIQAGGKIVLPDISTSTMINVGYHVQRMSDTKWLSAEGKWVLAEETYSRMNLTDFVTMDESLINPNIGDDVFFFFAYWQEANCTHATTTDKVITQPTCTATGTTQKICSSCGEVISTTTTPAKGHTTKTTTTAATCTTQGTTVTTCTTCGVTVSTVVDTPALGHQTVNELVKAPTSTAAGSYKLYCERCNSYPSSTEYTLPVLEKFAMNVESVTVAPGETITVPVYVDVPSTGLWGTLIFGVWEKTIGDTSVTFTNGDVIGCFDSAAASNITASDVSYYFDYYGTDFGRDTSLYYKSILSCYPFEGDNVNSYGDGVLYYMTITAPEEEGTYNFGYVVVDDIIAEIWEEQADSPLYEYDMDSRIQWATLTVEADDTCDHEFSDEWTIDEVPTEDSEGSKSRHCIHCGEKTDVTVLDKAIIGDVDGNGKVNVIDLRLLKAYISGTNTKEIVEWNADARADGKINIMDLRLIKSMISGN